MSSTSCVAAFQFNVGFSSKVIGFLCFISQGGLQKHFVRAYKTFGISAKTKIFKSKT